MEEYQISQTEKNSNGAYTQKGVHYWRPPCSCGIELNDAVKLEARKEEIGKVHFWRPPCSCGVSLDEVVE